jgi:hypothetical protein
MIFDPDYRETRPFVSRSIRMPAPPDPACARCGAPAAGAGAMHAGLPGAGEALCAACTRLLTITCSTSDLRPIRLAGRRAFALETK